jgi:MFS family permease
VKREAFVTETLTIDYADRVRERPGFYYGWVNLAVAALAMVATLPGRTQGLGLITEPLLRDLHIDRVRFGFLNLWATLIGSAFCLACGPLIDRFGSRALLAAVAAALGGTVLAMSRVANVGALLILLTLTRGFGQSALSVVSLTIVGKWFARRLPAAMALYSVLVGIGFCIAFPGVGYAVQHGDWRTTWRWIGWLLIGLALIGWLLVRRTPESMGLHVDGHSNRDKSVSETVDGFTLPQALRTFAFWSYALAATAFGLVSSGLMLFNEMVLTERGFAPRAVLVVLGVITFTGMAANFIGGWLARKWPIGRLMGTAMFLLAAALLALPMARGQAFMYAYAVAMGLASGLVTVVFFICWSRVFGRRHLGAIQGAAQLLTVLGTAAGPLLLAVSIRRTGSSTSLLFLLGPIVAVVGVCCLVAPIPTLTPYRSA